jgi:D-alanyl-D-alanine carboxypeptidase
MTLICVTLNAPDDWDDHRNLFEYGFSLYTSVLLQAAGTFSYSLPVIGVRSSSVNLTNANEVRVIIPEQHGEISLICEAPRWISGNIAKDQQIGQLIWKCDGEIIACEPLVATASVQTDVPKINFFRRLFHFFIKH